MIGAILIVIAGRTAERQNMITEIAEHLVEGATVKELLALGYSAASIREALEAIDGNEFRVMWVCVEKDLKNS